jgi:hypothetical protein
MMLPHLAAELAPTGAGGVDPTVISPVRCFYCPGVDAGFGFNHHGSPPNAVA